MKNENIKGPYQQYCSGFGFGGAINDDVHYVACISLTDGLVKDSFETSEENYIGGLVAFDAAEVSGPYLGQTNIITVSSFCGVRGMLWGYDLARHSLLGKDKIFAYKNIPVYDASPLVDSTKRLFGTLGQKRFPIIPGGHIPAASKFITLKGPGVIFGSIAIAIPRDRTKDAILFMEDNGTANTISSDQLLQNIVSASVKVAEQQEIDMERIFVKTNKLEVPNGYIGCVLSAVPYVNLAQDAFIENKSLTEVTLDEWEKLKGF